MAETKSWRRLDGRATDAMRPVEIELGPMKYAEGSALISVGDTKVLCAASIEKRVPPFLVGSGQGWSTAEYAMLPRATSTRSAREVSRGRPSGRSSEIQRLIGRSLRAVLDLNALPERTLTLDCDVLQADGGTRTASITGAYVAAVQALSRALVAGDIERWPVLTPVAAISVGLVDDQLMLDLDSEEDRAAQVDMNVVGSGPGGLVEIQGTAEGRPFARTELDGMVDLALAGIAELTAIQERVLAPCMSEVEAVRSAGRRAAAEPRDEGELWGPPPSS